MKIDAVYGCLPGTVRDNRADLAALVGAEKADAVVKATGFAFRHTAAPGKTLLDYALPACEAALEGVDRASVGAVVTVSFSRERRFPAFAAELQRALGLPKDVAALDLSMACSGCVYGLFTAERLAESTGRRVLLVDGDLQSRFTDAADAATLAVMSDACTATLVAPDGAASRFAFHTDGAGGDVLSCADTIRMDGFGVFRFVAGPVRSFLSDFLAACAAPPAAFVPHQANMYMVRQLADALALSDRLVACGGKYGNTGSCSVALALADADVRGTALLAGFGAGLSAAAVSVFLDGYRHGVITLQDGAV